MLPVDKSVAVHDDNEQRSSINVIPIPAFNDNYIWVIQQDNHCIVVDPGDATPVVEYLQRNQLTLTHVLVTHHHNDHIGGIDQLLVDYPQLQVVGLASERVPMINTPVNCGDTVSLAPVAMTLSVKSVPGHTRDHIIFFDSDYLFCGDTLFSVGCGRLFEGTPEQMLTSLTFISELTTQTKVCCAHEYTLANIHFALQVDPDNQSLIDYQRRVKILRDRQQPSLPTTLALELAVNPFLRSESPEIVIGVKTLAKKLNIHCDTTFATLRRLKDIA